MQRRIGVAEPGGRVEERAAICTIIAENYLAAARALVASVRRWHGGVPCYVLVVDRPDREPAAREEDFHLLTCGQIQLPDLGGMAFKYNVTEFATAVKPWLLLHLLVRMQHRKVLYFDPDVYLTGDVGGLLLRLNEGDLVLTPHLDADFPEDGKQPSDGDILGTGIFNLGFVGVRNSANALQCLEWWQRKLTDKCLMDRGRGFFVDQRFVDLMYWLYPGIVVERAPGYNAAYWNLHARSIERIDGQWRCNGQPLHFFHFSGYDPRSPAVLSKYSTRHDLAELPGLAPLFEEYREQLLRNGYDECSRKPYGWAAFENGWPVAPEVRRLYGRLPGLRRLYPDPFSARELKWLAWMQARFQLPDEALSRVVQSPCWGGGRFRGKAEACLAGVLAIDECERGGAPGAGEWAACARRGSEALWELLQREREIGSFPVRRALAVVRRHLPGVVRQGSYWRLSLLSRMGGFRRRGRGPASGQGDA